MNIDEFWAIVDASRAEEQEDQLEKLRKRLNKLPQSEIIDFYQHYYHRLQEAYRWDLWGAAYIINGGCSDDWFAYFRDWLIAQGREVYETALQDPESLRNVATPEEADFEDFRYVMHEVFEEKFEQDLAEVPQLADLSESEGEPVGSEWEEEELNDLFPKLSAWIQTFEE